MAVLPAGFKKTVKRFWRQAVGTANCGERESGLNSPDAVICLSDVSEGMIQDAREHLKGVPGRFSYEVFDSLQDSQGGGEL